MMNESSEKIPLHFDNMAPAANTVKSSFDEQIDSELIQKQRELEKKNRELFVVKQEIERLQSSYEKIYESSLTSFFTIDQQGIIHKLNQAGAELLGGSKEFILHKSLFEFLSNEYQQQLRLELEKVLVNKYQKIVELKFERTNKSSFFARVGITLCTKFDEKNPAFDISVNDITMFKVAEDALKESETRFQNMANTAPVLIWITDSDGLFTFVNNFWLQYTGRELGQELGMGWIENIYPDDLAPFLKLYKTSFDARLPFEIEFRIKKFDGNYRWIISKGVPRFHEDGVFSGFIGSCTDINDQKEIADTIISLNDELKSLNASKDRFFSIIAHDLKSPLTGLLGFTNILVEEYDLLSEDERREFIGHSNQATKNLMALLENLLEWSRIQIGSIAFSPELVNLKKVFEEIISLFEQNAKNKSINLMMNIEDAANIFADINMLNTILRNLISNGIKFTKPGGTVKLSAKQFDNSVKIFVEDTGVGINSENLKKLFKIDSSFSTPGTEKERGTGLGLMLCKELIEKNNGKIEVESTPGKGTTFILTLPKSPFKA